MVSVPVISLGHIDLFFIDQGTNVNGQYYQDVLLHQQLLPANEVWRLLYFSTGQRSCPQGT